MSDIHQHKFKIIKEETIWKTDFLGGKKKQRVITLQCEECGDVGFRVGPAGDTVTSEVKK